MPYLSAIPHATLMDSARHFEGVWCASATPLRSDLSINHSRLVRHVTWLLERGCDGVAVFGSTGEATSFSVPERVEAVAVLGASALPADRLLVGAGACAFSETVSLARAALAAGCRGLLIHPPFYFKNVSDDGLFAFLDRVVQNVGSDRLRIVLYHFPRLAVVGYSRELIDRLVSAYPTVFVGLKDSSGDMERMAGIAADHPDFAVLVGTERLLLRGLDAGAAGCLTATANLTSALGARVYETRDPDLQDELTSFRTALESAPFVPGIKRILADALDDPSWLFLRPPLTQLPTGEVERLRSALEALPPLPNLSVAVGDEAR